MADIFRLLLPDVVVFSVTLVTLIVNVGILRSYKKRVESPTTDRAEDVSTDVGVATRDVVTLNEQQRPGAGMSCHESYKL